MNIIDNGDRRLIGHCLATRNHTHTNARVRLHIYTMMRVRAVSSTITTYRRNNTIIVVVC
jgi:hypothetical protein